MRQITNPRHHEELSHRVFGVNFFGKNDESPFRLPSNAGFRLVDGIRLQYRLSTFSLLYDKLGVIDWCRRHTHARDRPSASVRLNTHSAFTDRRLSTFSVDLTHVGDETRTVERWPSPFRSAPRTASPARAWEVSARLAPPARSPRRARPPGSRPGGA